MTTKTLDFNYCECGCKGYEASAGKLHFWIYWDLGTNFYLNEGHGSLGNRLGVFKTMEEAKKRATDRVVEELDALKAAISS